MIKKQNSGWMRTIWQDLKTSCGKDCSISFPTEIWLRILSRRILKSKWCSDLPITPVARKENYLWIERYSKCSEKFTIRKARAIPNRKTGSLSTSMTSYRWTRQWARSIQQKNSGKFGLKLNGSAQSKRKSFEKSGPPFEVNHFFRLDRSDRNWPFHSTFSTHFQSQYLAVRYFPSVLLVHTCVVTTITKLCYAVYVLAVKNGLFPERLSNILSLFESGVRRSLNLTDKNLQSAQN